MTFLNIAESVLNCTSEIKCHTKNETSLNIFISFLNHKNIRRQREQLYRFPENARKNTTTTQIGMASEVSAFE